MKRTLSFSILLPVYKGSALVGECLQSIVKQGFGNYEIIIGEDTPAVFRDEIKKTEKVITSFRDKRINYFKNTQNLGYPKNLRKIASRARNDVLFLMGQDDILARDALQKTHDAFFLDKNIGAVTRPYFWYKGDISQPVRAIYPPDSSRDTILSLFDGDETVRTIFDSLGQLSGLALMRTYIDVPFHDEVFPAHIYPFAGILRHHKCVYLKDYTVAVRIESSQARHVSSIYDISPLESWVKMFNTVYHEKKYERIRNAGIKNIATQYVGFLQIKNFGPKGAVMREIKRTLQYDPQSAYSPNFWVYSLLTLLTPRGILTRLVDGYKKLVVSRSVKPIHFEPV